MSTVRDLRRSLIFRRSQTTHLGVREKAVSSVIAVVGGLEYGAIVLRCAAQLVEQNPLRRFPEPGILKIEIVVDDASRLPLGPLRASALSWQVFSACLC